MKIAYELNKEDIQRIIAKQFEVLPENVYIEIYKDWVGYGMGEHQESKVRVRIEKKVDSVSCSI